MSEYIPSNTGLFKFILYICIYYITFFNYHPDSKQDLENRMALSAEELGADDTASANEEDSRKAMQEECHKQVDSECPKRKSMGMELDAACRKRRKENQLATKARKAAEIAFGGLGS